MGFSVRESEAHGIPQNSRYDHFASAQIQVLTDRPNEGEECRAWHAWRFLETLLLKLRGGTELATSGKP